MRSTYGFNDYTKVFGVNDKRDEFYLFVRAKTGTPEGEKISPMTLDAWDALLDRFNGVNDAADLVATQQAALGTLH